MENQQQNPFLEQEIDLREYVRVLLERKWLIISCTLILCTVALIRVFLMKPVYESSVQVLIEKEAPRVVNIEQVTPETFTGREYYQTQYKILKSRVIAERVNDELGGYQPWSEFGGREQKNKQDKPPITKDQRVRALLGRVSINPIPNTQLVSIKVEDVSPVLAAKIANLWAENYISYLLDTQYDASQYASGWLQDKIKDAKTRLEKAEQQSLEYRKANKEVVADADSEASMLQKLYEKKAELEISLSENLQYYKSKHPEIIAIKTEIDSVERKIDSEKEKELNASDKEIKYNMLKREVDMNRKIYNSFLRRIGETAVTGELKTTNIRIIDKAIVPEHPSKPKKKRNLIIAFFIGIMGGSGLAFLIEGLDQSIKTPEDVKNHLRLPVLGSIAFPTKDDEKNIQPEFISNQKPRSTTAEAYRSLRTSIIFTAVEHKRKVILCTSAGPQEGKTTTVINLAIVMAQSGEKTILIDADLRQPKIEKNFNISTEHGMTEVLAGNEELDKVIHKTDIENLDVIACGAIPPNPSELLGSKKMDELLKKLGEKYDRILVDTPPVLAVTDAVVLSGKVDGVVVVVRAGETNRNAVLKTKEILEHVNSSEIIGTVLNMVETARGGGYHYYYHYYGKKYGHYGEDADKSKSKKSKKKESDQDQTLEA
ncbi:MAG: polysaccharide biosynthesis tyrosine autokinase [Candidatus Tantalella remota]|nr:polysaccharide biosynthesis tyrosine autokinase [Candidatus Tantalella remota]